MTGTGNTGRAAEIIVEELQAGGWSARALELRKDANLPHRQFEGDLLVLAFPVLGFGMPALVRSLLRGLRGQQGKPDGNGQENCPAAIFATWGGDPFAALWQAHLFLRRKGFRVIAAGGAAYPFNWTQVISPPAAPDADAMITTGDNAARGFAAQIQKVASVGAAAAPRVRYGILRVLLSLPIAFIYSTIGRFGLGALFTADERCIACGTCARDCPAAAITLTGTGPRRRPRWNSACQGCNRCINLCPKNAIQCSLFRAAVHILVNTALFVALVIGLNRLSAAAALPSYLTVPAWIALFIACGVYGSRLQFAVLEPLLFRLESAPTIRKLAKRSWTANFRRYHAPARRP
jgi:Pyruvate/2-oxoacid:ferredoxin oxidoreductase delta subunit